MKLLLIAYEFPPSPSPHSLRWAYLAAELQRLGHEVHVLAPDLAAFGPGGLPVLPSGVRVHRSFAGPLHGLSAWLARRNAGHGQSRSEGGESAPGRALAAYGGLNWKGRLLQLAKNMSAWVTFPDDRGEWERWALRRLSGLLEQLQPDVVISSHEPATTLAVGLEARRLGFPWLLDLGDPVLAPYTPRRWRRRAHALERLACRQADKVLVTTEATRALLLQRHGLDPSAVQVVTQGFDDRAPSPAPDFTFDGTLELLYTGRFYPFRPVGPLLDAVLANPGVRLSVASDQAPQELLKAAALHPRQVRLLGFLAHGRALEAQRQSHVLVNIGNDLPDQVPGKLYEYLGAGRPILYLVGQSRDAGATLVESLGRGIACANRPDAIAQALSKLHAAAATGRMRTCFQLDQGSVAAFGWSRLARDVADVAESILPGAAARRTKTPVGPATARPVDERGNISNGK